MRATYGSRSSIGDGRSDWFSVSAIHLFVCLVSYRYFILTRLLFSSHTFGLVLSVGVQKRLEFSIDIFSPHLDVSPASPHLARRIHQETLSTLLVTTPDLRMAEDQIVTYSESHEGEWAPWLVEFGGRVAERHAENLKVCVRFSHTLDLYPIY